MSSMSSRQARPAARDHGLRTRAATLRARRLTSKIPLHLILLAVLVCCSSAQAQGTSYLILMLLMLRLTTLLRSVLWSTNGHYYQVVQTSVSFNTAVSAAAAMTYQGLPGHLVTITSAEENTFTGALCKNMHCWIGGSDAAQEGTFRWIAGPENGQVISPTFWASGEPNNSGNEDYINYWDTEGVWNDGGNANIYYIVEYEPCKLCVLAIFCSYSHVFFFDSWALQWALLPSHPNKGVI